MSSEPFLKITYTPDYTEMFAVGRASRRYHFTSYQRYVWWLAVAVYFALALGVAFWGDPVENAVAPLIGRRAAMFAPVAVIALLGIVFVVGLYRTSAAMSAKWLARRKPLTPTTFVADAQSLAWENDEMSSRVRWHAIERLFVTPAAVCFIYGGQTLYLPRRLFAAPADLQAFVTSALAGMSPDARSISEADPLVKALLG